MDEVRICRGCGCDDLHACQPFGCSWVLLDIDRPTGVCSVCADEMDWVPIIMEQAFSEEAAEALSRRGYSLSTARMGSTDYIAVGN